MLLAGSEAMKGRSTVGAEALQTLLLGFTVMVMAGLRQLEQERGHGTAVEWAKRQEEAQQEWWLMFGGADRPESKQVQGLGACLSEKEQEAQKLASIGSAGAEWERGTEGSGATEAAGILPNPTVLQISNPPIIHTEASQAATEADTTIIVRAQ
jgi:hypothetical protein